MQDKKIKKLDNSIIDRKNILNNPFALQHIRKEVGIEGYKFENDYKYTLKQVANFYNVEPRTIENYISEYRHELEENGYEILTGPRLADFIKTFDTEIEFGIKTRRLALFNFKAVLNLGMLLRESEKARVLRGIILNIVIDVVSQKAGGSTKFINQRDEDYLISIYLGENYRKEFLEALKRYVSMGGNIKYMFYTNKIYYSIFKEKAEEYKKVLELTKEDKVRDTMYAEVLTLIASYETGLAHEIKKEYESLGRKLNEEQTTKLFNDFEKNPIWKPQIDTVRIKMSTRDNALRGKIHPELSDYIQPLNSADFVRFLGEKSKELEKRIEENKKIFIRLKNK